MLSSVPRCPCPLQIGLWVKILWWSKITIECRMPLLPLVPMTPALTQLFLSLILSPLVLYPHLSLPLLLCCVSLIILCFKFITCCNSTCASILPRANNMGAYLQHPWNIGGSERKGVISKGNESFTISLISRVNVLISIENKQT